MLSLIHSSRRLEGFILLNLPEQVVPASHQSQPQSDGKCVWLLDNAHLAHTVIMKVGAIPTFGTDRSKNTR